MCSSLLIELLEREVLVGKAFPDGTPKYRYKVRALDNFKMTDSKGYAHASGKECKGYVGWFERAGAGFGIPQTMTKQLNSKF